MYEYIKKFLDNAIANVASRINEFVVHPGVDFTRMRVFSAQSILYYLITLGVMSNNNELLQFFSYAEKTPSDSALCQQRQKVNPEAVGVVLQQFTGDLAAYLPLPEDGYEVLACDGTGFSFMGWESEETEKWRNKSSSRIMNSGHLTTLYNIDNGLVYDQIIEPLHEYNENAALLTMMKRHVPPAKCLKTLYITDRAFPSWNMFALMQEHGNYFLTRVIDVIKKQSQVWSLDVPHDGEFDVDAVAEIIRKPNKENAQASEYIRILIGKNRRFDLLEENSEDSYLVHVRVVRVKVVNSETGEESYATLVTNLPRDEFDMEKIREQYSKRWFVEEFFGHLKMTLGLDYLHSRIPMLVCQEVLARIIVSNFASAAKYLVDLSLKDAQEFHPRKYEYEADFTIAVNICMEKLREDYRIPRVLIVDENDRKDDHFDLEKLLRRYTHPKRPGRKWPRHPSRKPPCTYGHRAAV